MERNFVGTDKSLAISLFEYGVIAEPSKYREQDKAPDEWFVIYKYGDDFDGGFKRECELDELINGDDWADQRDIDSFLSWTGVDKEEWLKTDFIHKIQDCLHYWGADNIMGTSVALTTKEELIEKYKFLES